jgi:periplasmic protein TonB
VEAKAMARNTTLAPPEETLTEESHELEHRRERGGKPAPSEPPKPKTKQAEAQRLHSTELFAEALLDFSPTRPKRRTFDVVVSFFIHFLVLAVLLLIPLYFTEAIDLKQFTQTLLVAPPPPPPPPPPAAPTAAQMAKAPRRVFTVAGKLMAPTAIPDTIAIIKEEPLPPDVGIGVGVEGGVPGGVPGGQVGGVIGGILTGAARTHLPAPPPPAIREPIRVGGRIRAPRLVRRVDPVYPPLAVQARVQGEVVIDAVIETDGSVAELHVVSGHPLLIQSALDAVRRWHYEPTYLNEQPVPVRLLVTVRFSLN